MQQSGKASSYYAHSLQGLEHEHWEPLSVHLAEVAELAGEFAAELGVASWGSIAGQWHDLGKYSAEFQAYLDKENGFEAHLEQYQGRVDHSTAGAQHAIATAGHFGRLLAYALAGHHAGLADSLELDGRLAKKICDWSAAQAEILSTIELAMPDYKLGPDRKLAAFQLAFFTRMLFSCLVDADFLATEGFMDSGRAAQRPQQAVPLTDIATALDKHLKQLAAKATPSSVNDCRREVLEACQEASSLPPGLFSLTVPTGGGKTLSSLQFALQHAIKHQLSRVIYAIPFTSIIEQTAATLREALHSLGDEVVLEHHSNVDPTKETCRSRLMAENWDAPLVVTTNVQMFESLFANRTSQCRKLHNLVGSVIVLDEAQTLPVELLRPCIEALRELATNYRCSIVLCTATQPAIIKNEEFAIGLENVREIIPQPDELYSKMRRVEVKKLGSVTDAQLAKRLNQETSFLCIVNTRPHAAKLFDMLREQSDKDDPSLFHLSTLLCGEHRAELLELIRARLHAGLPCRVISTQLIEAGVDVDFPVAFRSMTGLDSIAQAAGRCNREGRRATGTVYLFDPEECQPQGYLGSVAATAREVLPDYVDPLDPAAVAAYFDLHYWKQQGDNQWDDKLVMSCFPEECGKLAYDFKTAAERFRMIENNGEQVYVPYGARGQQLINELRYAGPSRGLLRKLQRYTVSVYEQIYRALLAAGDVELTDNGYAILTNESLYDRQLGLIIDRPGWREPESLVV